MAKTETEPIVFTNITPNGTVIEYSPSPKRWYRVDGETVPSVTQILDVIHKPALTWWGMKVGIDGTLEMIRRGEIGRVDDVPILSGMEPATADNVSNLLTQHKLTVNHLRDEAGGRGNSVHRALEVYLETGGMPDPGMYPENESGYIEGLVAFIKDLTENDILTEIESEVMVGSKRDQFAGRFDLRCIIPPCNLVRNIKKDERSFFDGGQRILFDLKTSSGVYPSHKFQLSAYEAASFLCGYPTTDLQMIVRVSSDGKYEAVENNSYFADFIAANDLFQALRRVK